MLLRSGHGILLWTTVPFAVIISWTHASNARQIKDLLLQKSAQSLGGCATMPFTSTAFPDGLKPGMCAPCATGSGSFKSMAGKPLYFSAHILNTSSQAAHWICITNFLQDYLWLMYLQEQEDVKLRFKIFVLYILQLFAEYIFKLYKLQVTGLSLKKNLIVTRTAAF